MDPLREGFYTDFARIHKSDVDPDKSDADLIKALASDQVTCS